jgi:ankyrin repeat protein
LTEGQNSRDNQAFSLIVPYLKEKISIKLISLSASDIQNKNGVTALMLASHNKNIDIVRLLNDNNELLSLINLI